MPAQQFPSLAATDYTAPQKLMNFVMLRAADWEPGILDLLNKWSSDPSPAALEEAYEQALTHFPDAMQDGHSECRSGQEKTGLPVKADYRLLRHYEATAVASCMPDGSWVGWLYWHGGGKHGNPESIDWLTDAYPLTVSGEERVVVVRTFSPLA